METVISHHAKTALDKMGFCAVEPVSPNEALCTHKKGTSYFADISPLRVKLIRWEKDFTLDEARERIKSGHEFRFVLPRF